MRLLGTLFSGLVLTALATGCSQVGNYNITVEADKDLKANVAVDLVAIPESKEPVWRKIDMDKYANPNDDQKYAQSQGIIKTFELDKDHRSFTLKADDPIFKTWQDKDGKPKLFVMSNLTNDGSRSVGDGVLDFRRLILPLKPGAWDTKDIKIIVRAGGLYLETEPKPGSAIK